MRGAPLMPSESVILLRWLKQQPHLAGQWLAGQQHGRAQEHGGVGIVAAGVHLARQLCEA